MELSFDPSNFDATFWVVMAWIGCAVLLGVWYLLRSKPGDD